MSRRRREGRQQDERGAGQEVGARREKPCGESCCVVSWSGFIAQEIDVCFFFLTLPTIKHVPCGLKDVRRNTQIGCNLEHQVLCKGTPTLGCLLQAKEDGGRGLQQVWVGP